MKRLDRYLFSAVAGPFVAAQIVFIVLFIGTEALTEAAKLISRFGLPWWDVLVLLFLRMPWAIGWTMPMSVGMAVILAVGRLCHDTEYTAMVVGGMSFKRMLVPFAIFATLVAGVALWVQEYAGPAAMMAYYHRKLTTQEKASAEVLEVHMRLTDYGERRRVVLTAESLDAKTRTLRGVNIQVTEAGNKLYEVWAQRAEWEPEIRNWKLYNGYTQARNPANGHFLTFEFEESDVRKEARLQGYGGDIVFESSPNTIEIASTDKPDYLAFSAIRQRLAWMREKRYSLREVNRVRIYLARRWTLASSCLLFVLVGAPLAVKPQRGSGVTGAFALAVFLILVYYITWNATSFLGEGSRYPWVWAWSSNVATLILAWFMIRRVPD